MRLVVLSGWLLMSAAAHAQRSDIALTSPPRFVPPRVEAGPADEQRVIAWREEAQAYERGNGVPRDALLAAQLYCRASRYGDAESQFNLAWMLLHGRGIQRDDPMAAHLFAAAAEQGVEQARNILQSLGAPRGAPPECLQMPDFMPQPQLPPSSAAPSAQPPRASLVKARIPANAPEPIVRFVQLTAPDYRLEPHVVLALIAAESNFNPLAVSPKNAHGLMQLIPQTAARFGVKNLKDPVDNMRGGMAYLRWLLAYFEGDLMLALAAYNAGEKAVERYGGVPPYAETRQYVLRIIAAIGGQLTHSFDPTAAPPSEVLGEIRRTARSR